MEGLKGTLVMEMIFTFKNDGTAELVAKIKDMDAYIDMMTEYMYDLYAQMGFNKTQADQDFMSSMGMTIPEYAEKACKENDTETVSQNVYYVANDELYMGESWHAELTPAEIVVKGNKLTIYDSDMDQTVEFVRV